MTDNDLQLARILLNGFVEVDRRGRPHSRYLEEGSADEAKARKAFTRILRSNNCLDRQLRTFLAELFDPDPVYGELRTIRIVFRKENRPPDRVANTHVAEQIYEDVKSGKTVTQAIVDASERFEFKSEDNVWEIWGTYRPVLEQIYGTLPRPRGRRSKA